MISKIAQLTRPSLSDTHITYQIEVVDIESLDRLEEGLDLELRQIDNSITSIRVAMAYHDKRVDVALR